MCMTVHGAKSSDAVQTLHRSIHHYKNIAISHLLASELPFVTVLSHGLWQWSDGQWLVLVFQ